MSISIERGYEFRITPTGIELDVGGSTASWALSSLIATLNNGTGHFLVADFEFDVGTTWKLKTSVDGLPFVDQGMASGPAVAGGDTDPSISLSSAAADAYSDEVVMWVGHTEFTTDQLANLHALAATHGLPMSDYDMQFATTTLPPTTVPPTTVPPTTVPPTTLPPTTVPPTTLPPTTLPPTTTTLLTTTTPPTTTVPLQPHPADTNMNFGFTSAEVLSYANDFLNNVDATFPGISLPNRSAWVLKAALMFLLTPGGTYTDIGTTEPVDSQQHPGRWVSVP